MGVLACGLAFTHAAESEGDQNWRKLPLISGGKVDSDWTHIGYGSFQVEDGTIRTEPAPEGLGLLVYTKERLGNCQIRVVFKAKDQRANAGIYVRVDEGILKQVENPGAPFSRNAEGEPSEESLEKVKASAEREDGPWYAVHRGYEVQIAGGGDQFQRTGAIYSLAPSTAVAKPGEWQTMVITLEGTKINVSLDGKAVSSLDTAKRDLPPRGEWYQPKREPKRPEAGYIGLQTHDPGDVVWFREVSVRPLPRGSR